MGTNVLALECGGRHDLHISKISVDGTLQHRDKTPRNQQTRPHVHTVIPHLSVTHTVTPHMALVTQCQTHLVTPYLLQVTYPVTPHLSALHPVTKPHLSHTHTHAHAHAHTHTHTHTHTHITVKRCLSAQTLTVFIGEVVLAIAYFLRSTLPALASFSFSATSYNRHTRHTKWHGCREAMNCANKY